MTAVYLTAGERILLLYRTGSRVIGDSWTGTAGGHFEPEELNDRPRSSIEGTLRWFDLSEIAGLPMPFSARCMISHYLETGRFGSALYGGVSEETGTVFTQLREF